MNLQVKHYVTMMDLFLNDDILLYDMCKNIMDNKRIGLYDGAYKVLELAMGLKSKN